jgi:large subunit ribosomal protein L31
MKKGTHPKYRPVVFKDVSSDYTLLTRSTADSKETIEYEGKQYPLIKIDISSASHPFFTGKNILLDSAGRVEKFNRKFAKRKPKVEAVKTEEVKVEEVKAEEVKSEESSTEASS